MSIDRESWIYGAVLKAVVWGEARDDIFQMMATNGVVGEEAEELYRAAMQERIAVIRQQAMREAVKGGLMILLSVPLFWLLLSSTRRAFVLPAAIAVWGLWKLLNGVIDYFMAASKTGPVGSDE